MPSEYFPSGQEETQEAPSSNFVRGQVRQCEAELEHVEQVESQFLQDEPSEYLPDGQLAMQAKSLSKAGDVQLKQ